MSREEFERPRPGRVVTFGSDDDNEEIRFQKQLQMALKASRSDAVLAASPPALATSSLQRPNVNAESDPPLNPHSEVQTPMPQATATSSFLCEGAKLEQERLERKAKCKRGGEVDGSQRREETPTKRPRPTTSSSVLPKTISTLDKIKQVEVSDKELAMRMDVTPISSIPSGSENAFFWDGELRQTAGRSQPSACRKL